ncbi:MAG: LruC domain-containing protein [Bacteroidota bacterium]
MTYPRTYSRTSWVLCAALALVLAACDAAAPGESPTGPVIPGGDGIDAMQVPSDFDYATTADATVRVEARSRDDRPMANVRFDVYDGDRRLTSGFTNERGVYEADLVVAVGTTDLTVRTDYLGLPNEQAVTIENSQAAVLFGGDVPRDFGNVTGAPAGAKSAGDKAAVTFTYHSPYTNSGVPTTLVNPSDVVHPSVIAAVNAALPEGQDVPVSRPDYINDSVTLDIRLDELADVWVTFVHEGAGYKNALGFYTYDLDAPPASPADIAEHRLILPNVSYLYSGGGLLTGDKVLLGRFPANTGIGFFLVPNGWRNASTGVVERGGQEILYSNPNFNPEASAALRQHTVLLEVPGRDEILLAFEDIERNLPGCDQDFNDAVFYVTANPPESIQREDIPEANATPPDTDGDGVPDAQDDAPNDPTVATYEYGPARDQFGTLAYEDLWPGQGDYDFNDLVVDYNLRFARNAAGDLTKLDGQFVVKAIGAGYRNALALALPVDAAAVASVSGQRLGSGLFSVASTGAESGRTAAIVPVFDDANAILARPGGYFANTQTAAPYVAPADTVEIGLVFAAPVAAPALSVTWLNPFLVSNQERGREVHLPNQMPSEGADVALLGSSQDRTEMGSGFTYKNERGLPWALHFADGFVYPTEQTPVTEAYTRFRAWAESSGLTNADWYTNLGLRVTSKVYDR